MTVSHLLEYEVVPNTSPALKSDGFLFILDLCSFQPESCSILFIYLVVGIYIYITVYDLENIVNVFNFAFLCLRLLFWLHIEILWGQKKWLIAVGFLTISAMKRSFMQVFISIKSGLVCSAEF